MRRAGLARILLVSLAGLACACSGTDEPADGGADAGVVDVGTSPEDSGAVDTGPTDTGSVTQDAGAPDAGFDDNNDDLDEAFDARKNTDAGVRAVLAIPGDRDYYFFDGTEGEFVLVYTDSRALADGTRVDTVIRLYDEAKNQVAENDDAVPRIDVDSEIIYRLPATGRYFVEVLEWSDWAGETPEGGVGYTYSLLVRTVNANNPGITLETEAGNDAASAITAALNQGAGLICGGFSDASDVDVYRFTQAGAARLAFQIMPAGTDGHGATTPVGNVWLTDPSGANVIARLDVSGDTTSFSPAVPPGEYLLWLQHPGGAAGSNDFYAFKTLSLVENDPEVEPNDRRAIADARTLEPRETQMDRAAFVLARLPDGDVDYFSVVPAANETITVACGSRTAGSGVQGLTVQLQDAQGAEIASATEPADALALITDATVTSSVVFIKLSKTGQDADLSADFVRCGIVASP